ncbi:MAG: argS [Parachlamydiales bacterium]|nr:argS [Parachlamydiales bacterium]
METLQCILKKSFSHAIDRAFKSLSDTDKQAELVPCHQEGFGHYQCNSALGLSKILKKNPRAVAQEIEAALDHQTRAMCEKIEIAGPGFINITLSAAFLSQEIMHTLADPWLGAVRPKKKLKVVVDFSSPNVAKELHVGHIRSTIIGDCLCRLFEFLGCDVLRLNHIGDWGTQFGMLITYMKEHAPQVLKGAKKTDLGELMIWYKGARKLFDADPAFKARSQQEVVRLQSGEKEALHAWKIICDISRIAFQEIYDLLDVLLIERGESYYNPLLKGVVEELEKKGLVTISDNAKCIFLEGFTNREGQPMPLIVQKSDGGYNYDTTDLAAIRQRLVDEKANRIIYVVDSGQGLHFQMVFKAAEQAGWYDPTQIPVDHVGFGLVLGEDGKKFKTRSGETEKLIDLLTEAIDRAKKVVQERLPDASQQEIDHLARVIGIDAIKYSDLSCHRTKDYTFSYERMLRFEGNTAVFLLYAYVRINGIQRKTRADAHGPAETIALQHPSEIALALHLRRFGETLEFMARDLLPNRLTDYLYELAEKFNAFYRDCRVEGTPEEGSRLLLCQAAARVLKQGLEILGLQTVERM